MKQVYTIVWMLLAVTLVRAQTIPNGSFENWNGGLPVGWWGANNPDTLFVQSSNAYMGNSALRMNVSISGGITYGGSISTGDSTDWNFPVSSLPGALYGWYIADLQDSGDMLVLNSTITTAGLTLGTSQSGITEPSSVYKQFAFNYSYSGTDAGSDSAFIEFGLTNFVGSLSLSSYFIIDDLTFGMATGISEVSEKPMLEQCSPNPANGTANIIYSLNDRGTVGLALYDITGQKVKTLLDDTQQTPGRYKIPTDVSALADGVYVYSLTVNGQSFSQKLVVSK